jgi:Leucine-rich repeat (LRR) protein
VPDFHYQVYLDLSKNKLSEIPEDLQALRLLKKLNVSSNKLTSLPGAIFASFPRLNSFICSENQLMDIPEGLFKATTLTYLDFSANRLSRVRSRAL